MISEKDVIENKVDWEKQKVSFKWAKWLCGSYTLGIYINDVFIKGIDMPEFVLKESKSLILDDLLITIKKEKNNEST